MAVTIATFINSSSAPYVATALNKKRQRLYRLFSKACFANVATTGTRDYNSTAAKARQLVIDAATVTTGMTADQVEAARIGCAYGNALSGNLGALSASLPIVAQWSELDEDTLDRMELLIEYYFLGLS